MSPDSYREDISQKTLSLGWVNAKNTQRKRDIRKVIDRTASYNRQSFFNQHYKKKRY